MTALFYVWLILAVPSVLGMVEWIVKPDGGDDQ